MARSGQRHTAHDLAAALDQGYAFGIEFLELGLGNARERRVHAGAENEVGYHGGAILSAHALGRPGLIRLDDGGLWFDGSEGERRVGGRIALIATVPVDGVDVVFAAIHVESHSDPRGRAAQMTVLLDHIDAYAPGAPVIVGGDFNTSTATREVIRTAKPAMAAEEPDRLIAPFRHEPLFAGAAARGYTWQDANTADPTQRPIHPGDKPEPLGRIDWFFTRGLTATDSATVPAVDDGGMALSDHEIIALTVELA